MWISLHQLKSFNYTERYATTNHFKSHKISKNSSILKFFQKENISPHGLKQNGYSISIRIIANNYTKHGWRPIREMGSNHPIGQAFRNSILFSRYRRSSFIIENDSRGISIRWMIGETINVKCWMSFSHDFYVFPYVVGSTKEARNNQLAKWKPLRTTIMLFFLPRLRHLLQAAQVSDSFRSFVPQS